MYCVKSKIPKTLVLLQNNESKTPVLLQNNESKIDNFFKNYCRGKMIYIIYWFMFCLKSLLDLKITLFYIYLTNLRNCIRIYAQRNDTKVPSCQAIYIIIFWERPCTQFILHTGNFVPQKSSPQSNQSKLLSFDE